MLKRIPSIAVITGVFFSLCILRLWYTFLFLVILSLLTVLLTRKKIYCRRICPAGLIQDISRDTKGLRRLPPRNYKILRLLVIILYAVYIAVNLIFFYQNPAALWKAFFRMMILTAAGAVILQYFFTPRFWCSRLCPLGTMQGWFVRK